MATKAQSVIDILASINFAPLNPDQLKRISKNLGDTTSKGLNKAIADFRKAGFSDRAVQGFSKEMIKIAERQSDILENQEKLHAKAVDDEGKAKLKAQIDRDKKELKQLDREFKLKQKNAQKIADDLGRREAKSLSEGIEDKGEALSKIISTGMSKDFSTLTEGFGAALKKAGKSATEKGATMGGGLGGLLSTIGPALMGLGAVAGALVGLVKLAIDADSAAKELNRDLFSSGVTAGELSDQFGDIGYNLNQLQSTFLESSFRGYLKDWGLAAKDIAQVVGSYAQAGQTLHKIGAGVDTWAAKMEKVEKVTETTLTYAKLFGIEAGEMAGHISNWMEDLGENFESVRESLHDVHAAAMDSGFGVKRFFTLLNQATSDMSMYNVRLTETASLLTRMGKILGPKAGAEFVQQLTKGFSEETTQDRFKRIQLMGGVGVIQGIEARRAGATAEDIDRLLKGLEKSDAKSAMFIKDALVKHGVSLDPKHMGSTLAKLNQAQLQALQAQLGEIATESGDATQTALVNRMGDLWKLQRGATGGMGAAMVGMGSSLGAGGTLMALLKRVQGILGDKPISEIMSSGKEEDIPLKMFLESLTSSEREFLDKTDGRLRGSWTRLGQLIKEEQQNGADAGKYSQEQLDGQARAHGAFVKGGQIFAAVLKDGHYQQGKQIKQMDDLVEAQSETLGEQAKDIGMSQDTLLAKQMAENTTAMTAVLEQGVAYYLREIFYVVQDILNWMPGRSGKRFRQETTTLLRKEDEQVMKDLAEAQEKLAKAMEQGSAHKDEVEAYKAQIKALKGQRSSVAKIGRQLSYDSNEEELPTFELLKKLRGEAGVEATPYQIQAEKDSEARAKEAIDDARARTGSGMMANDFILQVGDGGRVKFAQRVDPGDVVVASKPSGAISRTAGAGRNTGEGGSTTNVFHLYNDGPGIVRSIVQAQQAGVLD